MVSHGDRGRRGGGGYDGDRICTEAALTVARRLPMSYGAAQDREALTWLQPTYHNEPLTEARP
jgi:hypothetical protein